MLYSYRVTADKLVAGQYGFLNRLLFYGVILIAVLAASRSWLCWVRSSDKRLSKLESSSPCRCRCQIVPCLS